jgi:hypothetical protein
MAIAAQQGLHLYGLDIFGAFITADIDQDEPVYVQLPKGLDPDNPESQPIWRLFRTLYGLKHSLINLRNFYGTKATASLPMTRAFSSK